MKTPNAVILFTVSLVLSHCSFSPAISFATDYYFHTTTTSDEINNNAPTATTVKFKDSPAIDRTTYQKIGIWSSAPLISSMQLESLSSLVTWIGLKNSDDQGTYFDLKAEIRKNEIVIASGEIKGIQGVTRNPGLAKEVAVAFGAMSTNQFGAGDVLSIRILTKVADSGGHNNAVGLRLYYDAVSRPSKFSATFGVASPSKLGITSINGGTNPVAGMPFSVTVQSQDANGAPTNVSSATAVSLSLKTGTGTFGGVLTETIATGTNQVTIFGVTYTKAESGVVITATRTSGEILTAADSAPFTVNPGTATQVAFATQPGNSTAGNPLAGPPTVMVQDSLGNTVTSSTASITIALGTNPGGGILSGTATKNAASGVASFGDLKVNQAGTGYTLTAVATGLTGATSSSFNITSAAVSLAAIPTSVPVGDPFTITWAQIPNPTNRDWIGLYSAGVSDVGYLDYLYVGCTQSPTVPAASGACSFPIPTYRVPGKYEFRLFSNDTFNRLATSNMVTLAPPSNLNKLAVTVGQNLTAGTPGFSMTVRSLTSSGAPANVSSDTAISVSLTAGTGVLSGILNGTILAATSQVEIGLATYSKAESGIVVTAARTSGDDLRAAASLPFTVSPGAAAKLVFTTQPGNATAGSMIPGPPTVTVQDNAGNTLTTTTAQITLAIGTNPGGGTLDDNLTVTLGSSVAFPSLIISQPGNGYTLIASSAGLQSATSNPFNISLSAGGGIISGVITRVSNGATISGALVEAYQGDTLRGTAVTDSSGNYIITGLATGGYTVRASFTGLVPQIASNVSVADGSTTPVDLSLNFGIAVQSPIAGATINGVNVMVRGNVDTTLAPQVGVTVNGYLALIDGDEFATLVPVDPTVTTLSAVAMNFVGTPLASDTVPITVMAPTTDKVVHLIPSPPGGLAPLTVGFSLSTLAPVSQIAIDLDGDGGIDFQGTSMSGQLFTYNQPGLFTPTVWITDNEGQTHTAFTFVQVLDQTVLDARLQVVWQGFKNALRAGDVNQAATFLHSESRAAYQSKLALFNATTLANIDQYMTSIQQVEVGFGGAQYEMIRNQSGQAVSFSVWFRIDQDGLWRIRRF